MTTRRAAEAVRGRSMRMHARNERESACCFACVARCILGAFQSRFVSHLELERLDRAEATRHGQWCETPAGAPLWSGAAPARHVVDGGEERFGLIGTFALDDFLERFDFGLEAVDLFLQAFEEEFFA